MRTSDDILKFLDYLWDKKGLILLIMLFFPLSYVLNNFLFSIAPYKLKDNIDTVITGDSQVERGINPDIIPNSINVAQETEPYILAYYKIKYIYRHNKQIKNVIIPVSPLHLTHTFDDIFADRGYAGEMMKRASFLIEYSKLELFDVNMFSFVENMLRYRCVLDFNLLINYFKVLKSSVYETEYFFIGRYGRVNDDFDDMGGIGSVLEARFEGYTEPRGLVDVSYMDSIARFCSDKDINLFIVGMPFVNEFYEQIPGDIKKHTIETAQSLARLPNVRFINCHTKYAGEMFYNYTHLNGEGSDSLSSEIWRVMREKLEAEEPGL